MGAMSVFAQAQARPPTDLRLALVIGNPADAGAPLPDPTSDAKAMSNTLRGMGSTVQPHAGTAVGQVHAE